MMKYVDARPHRMLPYESLVYGKIFRDEFIPAGNEPRPQVYPMERV